MTVNNIENDIINNASGRLCKSLISGIKRDSDDLNNNNNGNNNNNNGNNNMNINDGGKFINNYLQITNIININNNETNISPVKTAIEIKTDIKRNVSIIGSPRKSSNFFLFLNNIRFRKYFLKFFHTLNNQRKQLFRQSKKYKLKLFN